MTMDLITATISIIISIIISISISISISILKPSVKSVCNGALQPD